MKKIALILLFCASALSAQQFAYFYKPPAQGIDAIANANPIILTKGDEATIDALRAKGVQTPVLQYISSQGIQDPGSCSAQPKQNQAAYNKGDFCDINKNHKDWFLLDTKGNRLKMFSGYYIMDYANPQWQNYFISKVKAVQAQGKFFGVFLDVVDASISKFQAAGTIPQKYQTDSAWQSAVQSFLAAVHAQIKPTFGNIVSLRATSVWFAYLSNLDGAMSEATFMGWVDNDYDTVDQWLADLDMVSKSVAAGKQVIAVSQGTQSNNTRQQFAYVSYLLSGNVGASFRYANAASYNQVWDYPDYKVGLGLARGPMQQVGTSYIRIFQNGYVEADPAQHLSRIVVQCP